jgi:hypothetical protein
MRLIGLALFLACFAHAEVNRSWDTLVESIKVGNKVVVTRMNSSKVEGKLLAIDAASISVRKGGQPQMVQRDAVFRVRYADIRKRHTLLGLAIGAAAGAIILAASVDDFKEAGAAAGAILGTGIGAAVGGALPIGEPLYQMEKPKPPARPAAP